MKKEEEMTVINEIHNLKSIKKGKNVLIQHPTATYLSLPFLKGKLNLSDASELGRFIKGIETLIRKSGTYKVYIKHIRDKLGINNCAVFGNLSGDDVTLEMHHAIFTLYDCVEITLIKFLKEGRFISTFDIADEVLKDHIADSIPVAMVSLMVHKAAHPSKNNIDPLFIPMESMWGDLNKYIQKYKGCFTPDHISRLRRYALRYEKKMQEKSETFEIAIKSWKESGLVENTFLDVKLVKKEEK